MRKRKDFYEITPKILKAVERLAGKGCQQKDIAVSIGWSKSTFYKFLEPPKDPKDKKGIKESKDLADALKRGQSKRVVTLISRLAKRADGYTYKEKHIEDIVDKATGEILTQKVKMITKHMSPDVAALIFSLINLDGKNWSNKQELTHKGDIIIKTDSDDEKL
jgi:hypothetical protein